MEVRTRSEGKFYVLYMNPVSDRAECRIPIAASQDYEKLVNWYNEQRCSMYRDNDGYNKQFKKGSRLEYFNSIGTFEINPDTLFGHGIYEVWLVLDDGKVSNPSNMIVWL